MVLLYTLVHATRICALKSNKLVLMTSKINDYSPATQLTEFSQNKRRFLGFRSRSREGRRGHGHGLTGGMGRMGRTGLTGRT